MAQETRRPEKLAAAFKDSISMLNFADQLTDILTKANNVNEVVELLKALSLCLPITGARTHNKIWFPILFVLKCQKLLSAEQFAKINFSGTEGIKFYVNHAPKFTWKKKTLPNPEK